MVNIGRPSQGCLTCRRRRVKCDETRPNCGRCVKRNTACEWKDGWKTVVRHQEKWAEKQVAQRVERVQYLRGESSRQATLGREIPKTTDFANQPQLRPDVYAVDKFYADYALACAAGCPFLDVIHPLRYAEKSPASLPDVLSAVALINAANCGGRYGKHVSLLRIWQMLLMDAWHLMREADRYYGKALRQLAKYLSDSTIAKHDSVLLTVYLLGLYEVLSIDRHPGVLPWQSHAIGRLELLRLRGPKQLSTSTGRVLFSLLYHEHLGASLEINSIEILEEYPSWAYEYCPSGSNTAVLGLMHDVCAFLKQLRSATNATKKKRALILQFIRLGIVLEDMISDTYLCSRLNQVHASRIVSFYACKDREADRTTSGPPAVSEMEDFIERWNAISKDHCDFESLVKRCAEPRTRLVAEERCYNEELFCGRSPGSRHAGLFHHEHLCINRGLVTNNCRAMNIHLLRSLLHASSCLTPETIDTSEAPLDIPTLRKRWECAITSEAEDIAEQMPYVLGQCNYEGRSFKRRVPGLTFRAYVQMLNFRTVSSVGQMSGKHKALFAKNLRRISEDMGIGMASHILKTYECSNDTTKYNDEEPGGSGRDVHALKNVG